MVETLSLQLMDDIDGGDSDDVNSVSHRRKDLGDDWSPGR
jgi:hypothetical protein